MPEHRETMRVRWVDTDASGRIHFSAAFRYFEVAEFELLRALGVAHGTLGEAVGFPRVNVSATYKKALRVEDVIEVRVRPGRVGNSSVTYHHEIFHDGELAIEGQVTAVAIGPDGKSRPLPGRLRQALTS
jgi:YbgC/YbaW family acyl-CoA thioester hydrolase